MSNEPAVTVILPLYDCGPALAGALGRLAATDLTGCEVLVVDDGSGDGTLQLARAFAAGREDTRVLSLGTNQGVAAARNEALRHSRGEFVWFVDWDDEWAPSIVQTMLRRAVDADADVVVCRAMWGPRSDGGDRRLDGLDEDAVLTGEDAFDLVLRGALRGYLWNKLLRRSVLPDPMFPAMRSQSDFCGLVPVLAAARRVATVPAVLYTHLERPGSITNSREPDLGNFAVCCDRVLEVARALPLTPERRRWLLAFEYRFVHLTVANTALRLGRDPQYVTSHVTAAAGAVGPGALWQVARVAPRVALRSLLLRVAGRRYVDVYRVVVGLRARVRAGAPATAR